MAEWSLVVYGLAAPKGRPRSARTKAGDTVTYTPQRTRSWETSVRLQAAVARPERLLDGPLACQLIFYLPRPKSRPKRDLFPDRKPDLDNLAKAVLDPLEGLVYTNDSRIVTKILHKRYSSVPSVAVLVAEINDADPPLLHHWVPPLPIDQQKGGRTG